MLPSFADNYGVALRVPVGHVPRPVHRGNLGPLPDRPEMDSLMLGDHISIQIHELAGVFPDVSLDKLVESPSPDHANPSRRAAVRVRELKLVRHFTDSFLIVSRQGKEDVRQNLLLDPREEVCLILHCVLRLVEMVIVIGTLHYPCIVSSRELVGAQPIPRVVPHSPELDVAVTQNVRVRRDPTLVAVQKLLEHECPVVFHERRFVEVDADEVAYSPAHLFVLFPRALAGLVVVVPVAHVQPYEVMPLSFQEARGDRGVYSPGDRHDDFPLLLRVPLAPLGNIIIAARFERSQAERGVGESARRSRGNNGRRQRPGIRVAREG
mmetsp:Transcript_26661/g.64594  ORF Transcript_26661/g.64594 Transcript_26661/m.64594 type:complete len:323 (+) Transcript_26661:668-1636(+)